MFRSSINLVDSIGCSDLGKIRRTLRKKYVVTSIITYHEQCLLVLDDRGYPAGVLSHVFNLCDGKYQTNRAGA